MSRTITVNPLKLSSINTAIKELEKYRKMLQEFPSKYVRALSEFFSQTLNAEAPNMSHHWIMDIREGDGKVEGVFTFDGVVQFVEFGSGIVGSNNHEGINEEWLSKLPPPYNAGYESNKGGYAHYLDKNGVDYWVYPKNGQFYSTYGQRANPFIYRSVNALLEKRAEIFEQLKGMDIGV